MELGGDQAKMRFWAEGAGRGVGEGVEWGWVGLRVS